MSFVASSETSQSTNENSMHRKETSSKSDHVLERNNSNESSFIGDDFINDEMKQVQKEQEKLDHKAIEFEKNLRAILKQGNNKVKEDQYLREWFILINQKNSLIHKQLELELLQSEKSLEKRVHYLNKQLPVYWAKMNTIKPKSSDV